MDVVERRDVEMVADCRFKGVEEGFSSLRTDERNLIPRFSQLPDEGIIEEEGFTGGTIFHFRFDSF